MRRPPAQQATHELNPFGPIEMARTLAFLFVVGGSAVALSAFTGYGPGSEPGPLLGVAAAALLFGPILLWIGHRLSAPVVTVCLLFGQACITAVVYFDGPSSMYAAFYGWVAAESCLYLSRRGTAFQLVVMSVSYTLVLSDSDTPAAIQQWLAVMGTTVGLAVLVTTLRSRLEGLLDRLRDAALTDDLTGVPNRRAFLDRFEQELASAERQVRSLTLLIGDIDGFKLVNDRLGHPAGDEVLRRVAGVLGAQTRTGDTLARIGGEEFALLLPTTGLEAAAAVADRMVDEIRDAFADDEIPITISIGMACYPDQAEDRAGLMRAADQALYHAKEAGRDRVVAFDPDATDALRARPDTSEMQLTTVIGLAEALDIRDNGTAEHSRAVARYARMMARHMGFDHAHAERIELAGLLHDVGKIGISDRVLTKPGPLDDAEWAQMRTHPQIGGRLLQHPELADLRRWIVAHHERPDGRGYPFGLSGEEIPIEARILSVADSYEAMTAQRVYKRAMAEEAAREELRACAGEQFDPDVVEAFLVSLDSEEVLAHEA